MGVLVSCRHNCAEEVHFFDVSRALSHSTSHVPRYGTHISHHRHLASSHFARLGCDVCMAPRPLIYRFANASLMLRSSPSSNRSAASAANRLTVYSTIRSEKEGEVRHAQGAASGSDEASQCAAAVAAMHPQARWQLSLKLVILLPLSALLRSTTCLAP